MVGSTSSGEEAMPAVSSSFRQTGARTTISRRVRSIGRLGVTLKLVMPQPSDAWQEGMALAFAFAFLEKDKLDYITGPILEGFAANFRTEGSSAGGWQRLALRTIWERTELLHSEGFAGQGRGNLVPGFTAEHPILQRTGDYMRSWTQRSHPKHGHEFERYGQASVIVKEGSDDYRAEDLSLGEGRLPARPVHFIDGLYEASIGAKIEAMLTKYVETVHP